MLSFQSCPFFFRPARTHRVCVPQACSILHGYARLCAVLRHGTTCFPARHLHQMSGFDRFWPVCRFSSHPSQACSILHGFARFCAVLCPQMTPNDPFLDFRGAGFVGFVAQTSGCRWVVTPFCFLRRARGSTKYNTGHGGARVHLHSGLRICQVINWTTRATICGLPACTRRF